MPPPLRRLLLTGFEPFGEVTVNPSWECVKGLDGEVWRGRVLVRAVRLPVSWERGPARLSEEVASFRPDAVVMFGVAQKRASVSLERVAANRCDPVVRDKEGAAKSGMIDPAGPASRESTLPLERLKQALERAGVPVEWSDDAGGYLCNRVFWEARAVFPGPAGFIHVPPFEAVGEETLRRGVRAAAEAVAFDDVPLAIAQFAPKPGDVAANLARIAGLFDEAAARGARLVLFPELATSGIALGSKAEAARFALQSKDAWVALLRERVERSGVALALGAVEEGRHALFNSAFLFFPGREPLIYRKQRLFGHDFAWAQPGEGGGPWETPLGRIGVAICHDVVYSDIAAASRGCDLVLMPTNWIGDSGPEDYLAAFSAPVLAADRTGEEDGIRFAGRGGLFEGDRRQGAGREGIEVIRWMKISI
ncbi:MAG: nitrilase-related carbon-nitrogen hydrolase [Planctomycetota bacterium]